VPILLQKSFSVTPRKRAQNAIPGDGPMSKKDSLHEPRCRMEFYPSCILSDVRSTFATKSARSRLLRPGEPSTMASSGLILDAPAVLTGALLDRLKYHTPMRS
jgi:hypothetical protein